MATATLNKNDNSLQLIPYILFITVQLIPKYTCIHNITTHNSALLSQQYNYLY